MNERDLNGIVYSVGRLCRAVYRDGIVPDDAMVALAVNPAEGMAMVLGSEEARKADQNLLESIASEIPVFEWPKGGLSDESKSFFWLGFYKER